MKTLIRYSRRQVVSICGLILTLTLFLISSTVVAQEDSDPYPLGPALDSAAVLVEIEEGEAVESPTKQETRPLTVILNPDRSILPNPGPAVPRQLSGLAPEPLTETPNQPQLPAATADLIVLDIWSTTNPLQAGQVENVTFQIKNQGTANISTTFLIRLSIDGAVKATWSSGGLAPGDVAQAATTVTVNSTGNHQVQIEVDYDDRIVESNENNNIRTETWNWGTSPVDLIVEDIWSTTNPLQAGQEETVRFRIKNQGTEGISTTFYIRLSIDGVAKATWSSGGLAAGQAAETSTIVIVNSPGNHQVKIEVDFDDRIVESNENNNILTETWNWGTSPVDLIVEDIWSTTNPLRAGEVEDIFFSIKNVGTAAVPVDFHGQLLIDGSSAGTALISGLAAGTSVTRSISVTEETPGSHEVKVIVDNSGAVPEFNENNNSRVESWNWQPSPFDLVVDDVWSTTEPLEIGSIETIKLQIRNQGTEAIADNFETSLSVSQVFTGTVQTGGLAPGAATVKEFDIQIDHPGLYEVRVIVDSTNVVIENDEAKNEWVDIWEWIGEESYRLVLPLILRKD